VGRPRPRSQLARYGIIVKKLMGYSQPLAALVILIAAGEIPIVHAVSETERRVRSGL
jgi:hypothetical protein